MLIQLTSQNFKKEVLESKQPVLVDFWASWCGPCRSIGPVIEQLAEEFDGKAVVGKVNVDDEPQLAESYKVMSIPLICVFVNGEMVEHAVGARPENEIKAMLERHM